MSTKLSPYDRPWIWLLRESSVIALLGLAAWAVIATGPADIPQMLASIVLVAVTVALTMRLIADILAAGFCRWSAAMGFGLGVLVASIRYAWRKQ